jgi:co-chaperonin GroES (HSP10)
MSKLHLLNEKIAVQEIREELQGSIALPEHRLIKHELGRVVAVGNGKYRTGENKTMWVKEGDIVLYQLGAPQQNNALFKIDGKPLKVFHQGDVIARLSSPTVKMENFAIVGNWVLLSVEVEQGVILVPEAIAPSETFKFRLLQKGAGFDLPGVEIGDEVLPERGRCAPIEIDGKTYVFTLQDFIHGTVTDGKSKATK